MPPERAQQSARKAPVDDATMVPTELRGWLPGYRWYVGTGTPDVSEVGGFRLDDPAGAVGLEHVPVSDSGTTTCFPAAHLAHP